MTTQELRLELKAAYDEFQAAHQQLEQARQRHFQASLKIAQLAQQATILIDTPVNP